MSTRDLLQRTAEIAADYLDSLEERPVRPEAGIDELRAALGGRSPSSPRATSRSSRSARDADPGLMASPGGRFFGFVIEDGSGGDRRRLAHVRLGSERRSDAPMPAAGVVEEVAGAG